MRVITCLKFAALEGVGNDDTRVTVEIPCIIFDRADDEWPLEEGDPCFVVFSPPLCNYVLHSLCVKGEVDLLSVTELADLGMHIARVESLVPKFHMFHNVSCKARECVLHLKKLLAKHINAHGGQAASFAHLSGKSLAARMECVATAGPDECCCGCKIFFDGLIHILHCFLDVPSKKHAMLGSASGQEGGALVNRPSVIASSLNPTKSQVLRRTFDSLNHLVQRTPSCDSQEGPWLCFVNSQCDRRSQSFPNK